MKSSKEHAHSPLAVITGAASGIGLAATHRFLREGFRVAAVDRSAEGLQRVKRSPVGTRVRSFVCDLSEISSLPALAKRIVREFGPPQVLVNNAGVWFYKPITESKDEHWRVSLSVNLIAAAALARGFVPSMKTTREAAIVNVSSRNALSSSPLASSYDASKAGLLGLTRSLAVELGEYGIRVNAVCPGVIDTPANKKEMNDTTFVRNYLRLIPLNRFGTAEDIANAICFLASSQSAFMTGQFIVVDGGQICGQNYSKIFRRSK